MRQDHKNEPLQLRSARSAVMRFEEDIDGVVMTKMGQRKCFPLNFERDPYRGGLGEDEKDISRVDVR